MRTLKTKLKWALSLNLLLQPFSQVQASLSLSANLIESIHCSENGSGLRSNEIESLGSIGGLQSSPLSLSASEILCQLPELNTTEAETLASEFNMRMADLALAPSQEITPEDENSILSSINEAVMSSLSVRVAQMGGRYSAYVSEGDAQLAIVRLLALLLANKSERHQPPVNTDYPDQDRAPGPANHPLDLPIRLTELGPEKAPAEKHEGF